MNPGSNLYEDLFGEVFGGVLDEHQRDIELQTMPTEERPVTVCTAPEINLYARLDGMILQLLEGGKITRRTIVRPTKEERIDVDGIGRTMKKYGSDMSGIGTFACMVEKMGKVEVVPPTIVRYADPLCDGAHAEFVISGGMKHFDERTVTIRVVEPGKEDVVTTVPINDNIKDIASRFKYKK